MELHTNLVKILENVDHYPGKKLKRCVLQAKDNSMYKADLLPSEVDLIMELKILGIIDDSKFKKLIKLIEKYGSERYYEGAEDEFMKNLGPEL